MFLFEGSGNLLEILIIFMLGVCMYEYYFYVF